MRRIHPRTILVYEDHLRRPCKTVCDVLRDDGDNKLVVFTELQDNTGPSITNSAEHAILEFCEACNISPDQATFFERYEAHPDDLDLMIFEINNGRPANLRWRRAPSAQAKPILDCIDHE